MVQCSRISNSEDDSEMHQKSMKIKLQKDLANGVLKSKQQLMANKLKLPKSDKHYPNSRFTIEKWNSFRDFCKERQLPNEEIDELDGCIYVCGTRLVEMDVQVHNIFDSDFDETEPSHCKECFEMIPESYVSMPGGEW